MILPQAKELDWKRFEIQSLDATSLANKLSSNEENNERQKWTTVNGHT